MSTGFMIDLDGTILRLGTDWLSTIRRLNYIYSSYELFGENRAVKDDVKNLTQVQNLGIFRSIRKLKEILSDDKPLLDEVLSRVVNVLDDEEIKGASRSVLRKGAVELLDFLKGYELVIVSSNCAKAAIQSLESQGVETKIFAGMITRENVKNIKPDPEPLVKAIELIKGKNIQTDALIYIGDNADDVKAVKNTRLQRNDIPLTMISVGGGATDKARLKNLKPDYYAGSLKEVLKVVRRIVGK